MSSEVTLSYSHGVSATPLLGETIGANLRRVAATRPDAEVLMDVPTSRRRTYAAFDAETDTLARGLIAAGLLEAGQVAVAASGDLLAEREAGLSFDDPVNIQYTSGTTGFPKGATPSHHNILNNALFIGEGCRYTEQDRVCVPVPFYHCFGMVLGNLARTTHGACIVIPARASIRRRRWPRSRPSGARRCTRADHVHLRLPDDGRREDTEVQDAPDVNHRAGPAVSQPHQDRVTPRRTYQGVSQ